MTRNLASLLALVLVGFVAASCAKQKSAAAKAGDLDVQVAIEPDPPTTGENRLHILIRDASGKPVDDAQLTFEYDRPAMGAMPEMKGGGEVKAEGGGRYTIAYPLSMQADWSLTLGIDAPGHPHASIKLKVSPARKGFVLEGKGAAPATPAKPIQVPPPRHHPLRVPLTIFPPP